MDTNTQFNPDYAVHPGELLSDILEARGITQAELARRCGILEKTISEIVNGDTSVMADTAILLGETLGINAQIWFRLENKYKSWKRRQEKERVLHAI